MSRSASSVDELSDALLHHPQPNQPEYTHPGDKSAFVGHSELKPIGSPDQRLLDYRNRTHNKDQSTDHLEKKFCDCPNGRQAGMTWLAPQVPKYGAEDHRQAQPKRQAEEENDRLHFGFIDGPPASIKTPPRPPRSRWNTLPQKR
jgi:hypothetical protein